jgi:hypothetical protein
MDNFDNIRGALAPRQAPATYGDLQNDNVALMDELKYYQEELEYYKQAVAGDPWKSSPQATPDERFANRMLQQRVPDGQNPVSEELWITRSDILELLALIPSLATKDYRRFVRDWEDIETLSQGGGNRQIVKSRQERLLFEIQLMRSVPGEANKGPTERVLLATKRQESDQRINMPAQRKPMGWIEQITKKVQ